jgi:fumarate reductase flavoprotein subunit
MSHSDYDVIVVGSGFAGLCAALSAAENDASVLVVEAEGEVGGSSKLSGGIIMGTRTRQQQAAGIVDSPDNLFHDYMALNRWKVDAGNVRRIADEAGHCVEWLESHGVEYLEGLYHGGDEQFPRCHVPVGNGAQKIETLYRACRRQPSIEFAFGRRIDRIVVEHGEVVGVAVGDDEVRGRAVVLAMGGFGSNPQLLAKLCPDTADAGDWQWYIGGETARGDALELAESVGAHVVGGQRYLAALGPDIGRLLVVYFPAWLIIVNRDGRRFYDETAPYSVTQPLVQAQGGRVFAVFDDAAKRAARAHNPGQTLKEELPSDVIDRVWSDESIDGFVRDGSFVKTDTLDELAQALGVDAVNLRGTVARYNDDALTGRDTLFLKDPALMRPIETGPFYGAELRLCAIAVTFVGPRIDPDARVLRPDTSTIPGLFAAGECTGNILGDTYIGTGNSVTNCVVFGRTAGWSAARHALASSTPG